MPRTFRISDPKMLEAPQEELLQRARRVVGNLVGTSLSVEERVGWVINLRILRDISRNERQALEGVVSEFDVPISLSEHRKPPQLFHAKQRVSGHSLKL